MKSLFPEQVRKTFLLEFTFSEFSFIIVEMSAAGVGKITLNPQPLRSPIQSFEHLGHLLTRVPECHGHGGQCRARAHFSCFVQNFELNLQKKSISFFGANFELWVNNISHISLKWPFVPP